MSNNRLMWCCVLFVWLFGCAADVFAQEPHDSVKVGNASPPKAWKKPHPFWVKNQQNVQSEAIKVDNHLFVKAGVGVSAFMRNESGWSDGDGCFAGCMGVGTRFFMGSTKQFFIQPALELNYTGSRLKLHSHKATFRQLYATVPIVVGYSTIPSTSACCFGIGGYVSYGVGGKVYADNEITWLSGMKVADHPNTFGSQIGMERWDVGLRLEFNVITHRWGGGLQLNIGGLQLWRDVYSRSATQAHLNNISLMCTFNYLIPLK